MRMALYANVKKWRANMSLFTIIRVPTETGYELDFSAMNRTNPCYGGYRC